MMERYNIQKRLRIALCAALFVFALAPAVRAAVPAVSIESPFGGFVNTPIITVSGRVANAGEKFATLVYNGIAQRVAIAENGNFSTKIVVSYGDTLIEVRARNRDGVGIGRVSFFANVPKISMKLVLVWDTDQTDMDLWVTGPDGEKVFYGNKTGKAGGQLDIDVTNGYGPETFTHAAPQAGTWQIQVQNFSPREMPLTAMRLDMILFEGTDREERRTWNIVSNHAGEVVNAASFVIDGEGKLASIR
jgi:uncharacterized protein YfaP (DUF2135 family)